MSNYALTNNLSALPLRSTSQYDSELIVVDSNAGRPITARASYITNLNDLVISLSADHVAIGDFNIADPDTGLNANVVSVGVGQGALRVLTQDLDSQHDSFTIGDPSGNYAIITNSALNVFVNNLQSTTVTNWDVLSAAINSSTYTTLPSNPANEITILNNTGDTMYIKNASKTIGLPIDNNTSVDLKLVGNTSEVAIKASSANKTVFATFISYN